MITENRRSARTADYLPVEVHAVNEHEGSSIAGPFPASIIDISRHGACLLMPQIFLNGFHIFHSTRENDDTLLRLTISDPPELRHVVLTAVPIWMDLFRQEEIRAFKMGVEFTDTPEANQMKELEKTLKKDQEQRKSWWRKHCKL